MAFSIFPIQKNALSRLPHKKGVFEPPSRKNGIFEIPHTKNNIFEPPYKKWHFRNTPYKLFFRFDPPIQKWPKSDHILKNDKIWPPVSKKWQNFNPPVLFSRPMTKNGIFETPIQKMAFSIPPIQKGFSRPLYNKLAFSRHTYAPLYKKCVCRDPLYNKMAISRLPYKKLHFRDTPYKKWHLDPLQKITFIPPPHRITPSESSDKNPFDFNRPYTLLLNTPKVSLFWLMNTDLSRDWIQAIDSLNIISYVIDVFQICWCDWVCPFVFRRLLGCSTASKLLLTFNSGRMQVDITR